MEFGSYFLYLQEQIKDIIISATMPPPSTLRLIHLIRNAAVLAPVSLTLLFNDWKNAAHLKQNKSDWLCCDGRPMAVKCASVSRWA
jgi:hypothetical protein